MTINDSINALVYKNSHVPPVNQTQFNNPFLLLSSTRALNELVSNTTPSSRAKVADIEPKTQYQRDPTGKAVNVYTSDKLIKKPAKPAKPKTPARPKSNAITAFGKKESTITKLTDAGGGGKQKGLSKPKPKPKPKIKAKPKVKQPAGVNGKLITMSLKKKATVKAPYQMYTGY